MRLLRIPAIIALSGFLASVLSFVSWNLVRLGNVESTQFEYVAKTLWQGGIIISIMCSVVWLCLRQRSNKESSQRAFLFTLGLVPLVSIIIRVLNGQVVAYQVLQALIFALILVFAYSCIVLLEIVSRPEVPV